MTLTLEEYLPGVLWTGPRLGLVQCLRTITMGSWASGKCPQQHILSGNRVTVMLAWVPQLRGWVSPTQRRSSLRTPCVGREPPSPSALRLPERAAYADVCLSPKPPRYLLLRATRAVRPPILAFLSGLGYSSPTVVTVISHFPHSFYVYWLEFTGGNCRPRLSFIYTFHHPLGPCGFAVFISLFALSQWYCCLHCCPSTSYQGRCNDVSKSKVFSGTTANRHSRSVPTRTEAAQEHRKEGGRAAQGLSGHRRPATDSQSEVWRV